MGTVGLASQAVGAGDRAEVSAILSRALLIGFAGGLLLLASQSLLFWAAFAVSPASDTVESLARDYMVIRIWSAPAAVAMYGVTGWLIAQERTRAVLILQLWMNGLNVALDLWFVLGLGWGVEGVATATLIAEWSALALALYLCRDGFRGTAWRDPARLFDSDRLRRLASVSGDILLRSLMLEAIFVSFLLVGASFGDGKLAANQILLQFAHITAYALDGFAFAAEALVGNAFGRQSPARVRQSAAISSLWGGVAVVAMALAFALAGGQIIDIMTTAQDVRVLAREYLIYMVLAPLIGLPSWMLDGIFIGATRTRDMRNMMVISLAVYVAAAFALVPLFDNHGLWIALLLSYVARGVTLGLRYPALERAAG